MSTSVYYDCLVESIIPARATLNLSPAKTKVVLDNLAETMYKNVEQKEKCGISVINISDAMRKLCVETNVDPQEANIPASIFKPVRVSSGKPTRASKKSVSDNDDSGRGQVVVTPEFSDFATEIFARQRANEIVLEHKSKLVEHRQTIADEQRILNKAYSSKKITLENCVDLLLQSHDGVPYLYCYTTVFTLDGRPDSLLHKGEMLVDGRTMIDPNVIRNWATNLTPQGTGAGLHDSAFNHAVNGKCTVRTIYAEEGLKIKTYCSADKKNFQSKFYVVRNGSLLEIDEVEYKAIPYIDRVTLESK